MNDGFGIANFILRPRRIEELVTPDGAGNMRVYPVTKKITLEPIDFENFITDMLVDRQFLEGEEARCGTGKVWRCVLVGIRGKETGVLVIPQNGLVRYAALGIE